ncbi:hypothetical protein JCM8547_000493 [Rhodosporidiobolus lusitaniae]
MQFNRPDVEGFSSSFPEGATPSQPSPAGAGPHPSSAGAHPHGQPHPSSFPHHAHPSSHPHYPYAPRAAGGYGFSSFFNWPRLNAFSPFYHPSFAAPGLHGSAAPPPPPHPPFPSHPASWFWADRRTFRHAYRAQRRGPRWLPFLLLAGGGLYAYKSTKREIRDVKAAVAAGDGQAARVLEEREKERCGRHGHWGAGWREQEKKWEEWKSTMAEQQRRRLEQAPLQQAQQQQPVHTQPVDKLV